ncbi:MAG: hypothetical protein JSU66_07920 [Deltaproteobacteria bacterium]|nr:MAG: hypothetical protein JSU66_07920 [Deltaproteobacteria bacterium]
METVYLWPGNPALSILVLWLVSAIFLWAAREPMLQLVRGLAGGCEEGFRAIANRCASLAEEVRSRSRAALLAAGSLESQSKLERELHRLDGTFSGKLGQYATLHRSLDDLLQKLASDYERCGDSPPDVPGWSAAVEALASIPVSEDRNVQRILESIRRSSQDAEKKALRAYREDTAQRHRILGAMGPCWREIRGLMARMKDAAEKAVDGTASINRYVERYESIRKDQESAARALSYSATKLFVISLVVLIVALGGAFINFQLIALPMSELVPAGARIGSLPVSTVSALVIVLMEAAVGIFIMDMLGITDLFPKLATIAPSRRRLVLGVAIAALFFLASVESSLAVLREKIVEADAALKLALAGEDNPVVAAASTSMIPVVGQAVLGFALPWIIAMVAIPLEMLLDSGRHVATALLALLLDAVGHLARMFAHVFRYLTKAISPLYDAYISIPVRIERMLRAPDDAEPPRTPRSARAPLRKQPAAERPVREEGAA